ncbi:MAG: hypothetical protein HY778_16825 [Betaproteobacteria bacterium]|nr:hypothetical protein [Betaproteobacteria bacterium]
MLAAALLVSVAHAAQAERLLCHTTYGGETHAIAVEPVASPYGVAGIPVGSYFLFRPVLQNSPADLASVKIYTYVARDEGPSLIHQVSFAWPPPRAAGGRHGFTGLQRVYEPVRDSELEYWCEHVAEPAR